MNEFVFSSSDDRLGPITIFKSKIYENWQNIAFFYDKRQKEEKYIHDITNESNFHFQFDRDIKIWSKFIKKNSVVIDIGAYCGDTTLPMAYLAGEKGKCIAFEPNPKLYPRLILNKSVNPATNIECHNYAIMEEDGKFDFRYGPELDNGGPALYTSIIGNYTEKIVMEGRKFSSLVSEEDMEHISFIKLDTEGYDNRIILALKDTIDLVKPVIQTEWFPCIEDEMIEVFNQIGYRAVHPETLKEIEIKPKNRVHDLILLPK